MPSGSVATVRTSPGPATGSTCSVGSCSFSPRPDVNARKRPSGDHAGCAVVRAGGDRRRARRRARRATRGSVVVFSSSSIVATTKAIERPSGDTAGAHAGGPTVVGSVEQLGAAIRRSAARLGAVAESVVHRGVAHRRDGTASIRARAGLRSAAAAATRACSLRIPASQRSGSSALRCMNSCTSGWGRIRNRSSAMASATMSATSLGLEHDARRRGRRRCRRRAARCRAACRC